MMLPVAILAGGLATRLRPLTEKIPKALIEVGGKPFIEHQLDLLQRSGCQRVVICVGFLGEMIETALGNGKKWGMDIYYVYDGKSLLGTGGALLKAAPYLGENFFVLYGDSYLNCDYLVIEKAFIESGKQGLMTVFRNKNQWDGSNILFKNKKIVSYNKQSPTSDMEYIDYGLGVFSSNVLASYSRDTFIDLANIYQELVAGDELAGFEVDQRFYEIGSPAGLDEMKGCFSVKEQMG